MGLVVLLCLLASKGFSPSSLFLSPLMMLHMHVVSLGRRRRGRCGVVVIKRCSWFSPMCFYIHNEQPCGRTTLLGCTWDF